METDNEKFMLLALKEAKKALQKNEVPIGAVLVHDKKIIAKAHNSKNLDKIATHHAEIKVIEKACKKLGDWRLENCSLYVTLEPCPMCAGAITNARIKNLYFGAYDKSGTNKNLLHEILNDTRLNHKTNVVGGILNEQCSEILSNFFKNKRG